MPIMVLAADKTLFSVTSGKGSKGDVVSIYVKMQNNDKFGMFGIKLTYDKDVLSYEDGSLANLEKAYMKGISENNGVITIYALALDNSIVVKDSLAKLDFKINDDSKEKVEIDIKVTDYGKDEVTPLQYEVKNGEIVINSNKNKNNSKNDETDKKQSNENKDNKDSNNSNDSDVTEDKEGNEEKEDKENNLEDEKIDNNGDSDNEIDSKDNKINYILMSIIGIIGAIGIIVVFKAKK